MNLLIVDDELYVVRAIRSKIDWKKIGIDEVFVAFNTQKAREIFLNETVDIIITDIEMPMENGLELMGWVRAQGFETKAICLTCHADFDYAAQALRLGFSEYYVKPVDFEKLEQLVAKVVQDIRREQELLLGQARGELWENNRNVIERHFWEEVLYGSLSGRAEAIMQEAARNQIDYAFDRLYNVLVFRIRKIYDRQEAWQHNRSLMEFVVINIAAELLAPAGSCAKTGWNGDYLWVVTDVNDVDTLDAQMQELIETCHQTVGIGLAGYLPKGGGYAENLSQIYDDAILTDTKNVTCSEGIVNMGIVTASANGPKPHFNDVIDEWHDMLANANFDVFYENCVQALAVEGLGRADLHNFIGNVNQVAGAFLFERKIPAGVLTESERIYNAFCRAADSVDNALDWVRQLIEVLKKQISAVESENQTINILKDYIHDHLEEKLSREQLAAIVYLSPGYVTRLFRQETGTSLSDYIVTCRVERARALLKQKDVPVGDIAQLVGYDNFSYFSELFKKRTGLSPSDYRKTH